MYWHLAYRGDDCGPRRKGKPVQVLLLILLVLTLVFFKVIDPIGRERFSAVSSDNTGNTRVSREILSARMPTLLNLPDPSHHINNTWKDIANLPYFTQVNSENIMTIILALIQFIHILQLVKQIRGTIKFFKQSGHSKTLLREFRDEKSLGPGLESIGKTRFGTLLRSAVSLQRCISGIRDLSVNDKIEIMVKIHHTVRRSALKSYCRNIATFLTVKTHQWGYASRWNLHSLLASATH